jgi:hypothetical protein
MLIILRLTEENSFTYLNLVIYLNISFNDSFLNNEVIILVINNILYKVKTIVFKLKMFISNFHFLVFYDFL